MSSALHFKCNMMLGTIWTDAPSFVNCWINFPPLGFLPRFLLGAATDGEASVGIASVASVGIASITGEASVASVGVASVGVASVGVASVASITGVGSTGVLCFSGVIFFFLVDVTSVVVSVVSLCSVGLTGVFFPRFFETGKSEGKGNGKSEGKGKGKGDANASITWFFLVRGGIATKNELMRGYELCIKYA